MFILDRYGAILQYTVCCQRSRKSMLSPQTRHVQFMPVILGDRFHHTLCRQAPGNGLKIMSLMKLTPQFSKAHSIILRSRDT
ncbi:hypothetical protein P692DRAFT_201787388 [Suillus brevipes Sb2]|nr:hypothetical protein P692DRAFT_201787388 [Suillus brevipes Sb2]